MPRLVENALVIYTDGSLFPRGRKGGFALVFVHIDDLGNEKIVGEVAPPGVRGTTGNRMELTACLEALERAPAQDCFTSVGKVVIRTDSSYVSRHVNLALFGWRKAGWRNKDGRPVDNADLWKQFVKAHGRVGKRVEVQWIKGHGKGRAKDIYNDRADKLARESAQHPLSKRVYRSSVRRKKIESRTRSGSVQLTSQQATIFIVETMHMPQREWKYRYQMMSSESPDFGNTDWIYSNLFMRDGHYYEVRLNDDMNYPRVLEILKEDADPPLFA